jgi:hypothetical protein
MKGPIPRLVASARRIITTTPRIIATTRRIIATTPRIIATARRIIATTPRIIATTRRIIASARRAVGLASRGLASTRRGLVVIRRVVAIIRLLIAATRRARAPHDLAFGVTSVTGTLFSDAACTMPLTSGTVTLPAGANSVTFGFEPVAAGQSSFAGTGAANIGMGFSAQ